MVLTERLLCQMNRFEKRITIKVRADRERKCKLQKRRNQSRRLYALAVFIGYRRGKRQQHVQTSLLKIQGSCTKEHAAFYIGKKCAFLYKPKLTQTAIMRQKKKKSGKAPVVKYRAIWGKVTRSHGNSGCVRAKFATNLPPIAIGRRVRIMLYPSKI